MTAGLLALFLAAPPDLAGLQTGDELVYTGTISEGVERPGRRFRRSHGLEVRVLVLNRTAAATDLAILTRLQRRDDAVGETVGAITGETAGPPAPPLIRLDLVRVGSDGVPRLLLPAGPPPWDLTPETPTAPLPPPELDTFSPYEFGMIPPRPTDEPPARPWTVPGGDGRPPETWQARDIEFVHAERCRLLVMNQMSDDWEKPVGGQTAWHRAEAVWVSTRDGTARRVHRVIRQRDGRADTPSAWVEVRYELTAQGRLVGRTLERTRHDVETAYATLAEIAAATESDSRPGGRSLDARLARLDARIEELPPGNPYREALAAARRGLEQVRRGTTAPLRPAAAASGPSSSPVPAVLRAGEPVPDVPASPFRPRDHLGQPVLLIFFRPDDETTTTALTLAQAAARRSAGRLVVAALTIGNALGTAGPARDRLRLDIPVYDGSAAAAAYGIASGPRFVLIDGAGRLAGDWTGTNAATAEQLHERLDNLLPPVCPAPPNGTIPASGLCLPPIVPRP